MIQSSTPARVSRRIFYIIPTLILILAIGLSIWWNFASRQAVAAMDEWLLREAEAGREWTCTDHKIAGYPFRIEIECPNLTLNAKDGAIAKIDAGRVFAVWQIYQPNLIIVEFDRRLVLQFRNGATRELKTKSLRMSLHFDGLNLPDRLALVGENIDVPDLFSSQSAEIHVIRGGQNADPTDLSLYVESHDMFVAGLVRDDKKPMTILADTRASQGAILYSHGAGSVLDRWREADGRLYIHGIKITRGDGDMQIKGTLSLDDTHRLNGKIDLKANGFADLFDLIGLKGGNFMLNAATMTLPLSLDHGRIYVGPLKIGEIAPLY